MTKRDKIIDRLLSRPKDFTYDELVSLLKLFGYEEAKSGKTSGPRRAFISNQKGHIIRLHKPHPGNVLRMYQIDFIIQELKREKLL
jgi:hypothetical protein